MRFISQLVVAMEASTMKVDRYLSENDFGIWVSSGVQKQN